MSLPFILIIHHNKLFQHIRDTFWPFLLNLRKYGDYCFLRGLDILCDNAVIL